MFFFRAEGGLRGAQESRGLGNVYKGQVLHEARERLQVLGSTKEGSDVLGNAAVPHRRPSGSPGRYPSHRRHAGPQPSVSEEGWSGPLYTSDAADE